MIEAFALAVAQLISERPTRCDSVADCPNVIELRHAISDHEQQLLYEVGERWQSEAGLNGVVIGPHQFKMDGPKNVQCVGRGGLATCSYSVVWGRRYRESAIANLSRSAGAWAITDVNSLVEALN